MNKKPLLILFIF